MAALPPGPNILVSFKVAKEVEDTSSVYIPIRDSNEVVEVPLSRLPEEPADIIDCLKPEIAPLDIWLKFAVEYYKRGKVQQFKNMLEEATGPDAAMVYKEEFSDLRTTIYNTLGAYYVEAGSQTKDAQTREKAFQAAIDRFNVATRVSQSNPLTYVGKGLLFLAKNNLTQADSDGFKIALELDKECVPALLGKACILFHQGKFEDALTCYRRAMSVNPACPVAVRLGIGLCLFKLKETAKAKAAFQRVLSLDAGNVHALVALATLELNQADECFGAVKSSSVLVGASVAGTDAAAQNAAQRDEIKRQEANDHLRNAADLISRAYQADPLNPQALIYLANAFFFRGELQQSRVLAQRALDNAQSPEQEAESAYQLARAFHAEGESFRAFNFYSRAVDRNPNHWLATFGLGQMLLGKKSIDKARETFEKIIRKFPDNYHVIRILGGIYAQIGETSKAKETLKRGTKLFPLEFDLWVELARVCEKSFPLEAYQAYTQAIAIPAKKGIKILPEFWNNLGVITHKLNKFSESKLAYEKALEGFGVDVEALKGALSTAGSSLHRPQERPFVEKPTKSKKGAETKEGEAKSADGPADMDADEGDNDDGEDAKMAVASEDPLGALDAPVLLPPESVSTAYNYAVLFEAQEKIAQAVLVHRLIIRQHKYISSFLRMGQIERASGDTQSASWWFKRALDVDKKNVEAHILIGNLHLERRDFENAIKWYDRLLKHVDEKDVYGKLAASGARLAAVTYNLKKQPVPKPEHIKDKEKELRRSAGVFREILMSDPSNAFAANGLGVVLAENGQPGPAKDLFTKLREATGEVWEIGLNLAHTLFAADQFDSAVKVYANVMHKFALHSDPMMLLYLARAYYHQDLYAQAKTAVVKALRIRPQDPVIWYNLALICEHYGVNGLKRSREQNQWMEVRRSIQELNQAQKIFARLEAQLPGPEEPLPSDLPALQREAEEKIRSEKARLSAARAATQAAAQSAEPPHPFPSLTGYPAAQPPKDRFRLSCSPEDEAQLHAGKARAHRKFVAGILINDAPQHLAYAAKQEEFQAKIKEKGEQARIKAERLAAEEAERKQREEEELLAKQQAQAAETKRKLEQLQQEWAVERAEKERREREKKADEEDEKAALDKLDDDEEFKEGDKEEEEEAASGSDTEKKKRKKRKGDSSSSKDSKKKRKKRKGKGKASDEEQNEEDQPAEEEAETEQAADQDETEPAAEPAEAEDEPKKDRKRRLNKGAQDEEEVEPKEESSEPPAEPAAAESAGAGEPSGEQSGGAGAEDEEDGAVRRNTKRLKKRVADDEEEEVAAPSAVDGGESGNAAAASAPTGDAEPPAA